MKKYLLSFVLLLTAVVALGQNKEIDQILHAYTDSGDVAGMVAVVAHKEKVLTVNSAGYQDIAKGKRMAPDALFWIASQSKPIAGAAVMMLVDEGKLDLDAPVATYLPELGEMMVARVARAGWRVEEKTDKPITLRQLMSHTSGMSWVASAQEKSGKIDIIPLGVSVYVSAATPLLDDPGKRYSYSNQGVNIAAAIIERVSGASYHEFLQKRIFDPLTMVSATFWPTGKQLDKLAVPYKMKDGKLVESTINQLQYPLDDRSKRFAEAAGGLFCTPVDLVKLYQMIACGGTFGGKRLLSEKAVAELAKKQTPETVKESYSLGWKVGDRFIGHGGSYGTDTRVYISSGHVVLYFVQEQGLKKSNVAKNEFYRAAARIYNFGQ
ncbi:serine hydrolase [Bacteroidia bacterium]|nr:serine hydrolase [Bacteroidia bacterium]